MDTSKQYKSIAGAAKDFFGAPSAQAFMEEWKQLTQEDKDEILQGLRDVGYSIEVPVKQAS
jgi:hypothetical protein